MSDDAKSQAEANLDAEENLDDAAKRLHDVLFPVCKEHTTEIVHSIEEYVIAHQHAARYEN